MRNVTIVCSFFAVSLVLAVQPCRGAAYDYRIGDKDGFNGGAPVAPGDVIVRSDWGVPDGDGTDEGIVWGWAQRSFRFTYSTFSYIGSCSLFVQYVDWPESRPGYLWIDGVKTAFRFPDVYPWEQTTRHVVRGATIDLTPYTEYLYDGEAVFSLIGEATDGYLVDYLELHISGTPGLPPGSPEPIRTLTISALAGGIVLSPGEGIFQYADQTEVLLEAKAAPGYKFVGWRGSLFVDSNPGLIAMRSDYRVHAYFESTLDTLYVDDDGPGDPLPGDPNISDPQENGKFEHPFDCVQEAIDVARRGARIVVRPGTYHEAIDLLGKAIEVNGLNEGDLGTAGLPVIDAQGRGVVVRCTEWEDRNTVLCGLVITGGRGRFGGIMCVDSSPTIANCVIVGNRSADTSGAGGIYCKRSDAAFINCTIADNWAGELGAGVILSDSGAKLSNCIVWGNEPSEIQATDSEQFTVSYTAVAGGWPGTGNSRADPGFALPGYWTASDSSNAAWWLTDPAAVWTDGDYHLMSQAGRWDPTSKTWVQDTRTSPCIDAGDPGASVGQEPMPNGGRINLGAYGGTSQASMSPE